MATVVTTTGLTWIIDKLTEDLQTCAIWTAATTGAGTAAVGDTGMFGPGAACSCEFQNRSCGTQSQPAADKMRSVATVTLGSNRDITNAGLFSSTSTAGTDCKLLIHGDHATIVTLTNDKIEYTIDLQAT